MIQTQITISQYEVGDILDVSDVHPKLRPKVSLHNAQRAMVVRSNVLRNGTVSYGIVTDNGYLVTFTHDEQGAEKFIGHIDLSALFDEKTAQ